MSTEEMDLVTKRKEMTKQSWIKNVMRIHPEKTIEQAEALYIKIYEIEHGLGPLSGLPCDFDINNPDKVKPL
jgi:hypothetical protein